MYSTYLSCLHTQYHPLPVFVFTCLLFTCVYQCRVGTVGTPWHPKCEDIPTEQEWFSLFFPTLHNRGEVNYSVLLLSLTAGLCTMVPETGKRVPTWGVGGLSREEYPARQGFFNGLLDRSNWILPDVGNFRTSYELLAGAACICMHVRALGWRPLAGWRNLVESSRGVY